MTTSFIPESAPFNEEQRAWLNGFFAGMMGLQSGVDPAVAAGLAGVTPGTLPTPESAEEEEDFPWHDSALPIVDRLEMADGKPLDRKLMAAMAQLDCGTCGYVCQTYAEAIASGEESSLTLCTPGGKETSKAIKRLLKESDGATGGKPVGAKNGTANGQSKENGSGYSRQNPYSARLVESRPLNGDGSAKDTRHVVIDLDDSGIQYGVGDALGVYPSNCDELTSDIIRSIGADPKLLIDTPQGPKALQAALCENYCLKEPSDELLELAISRVTDKDVLSQIQEMLDDGTDEGVDVLDVLQLAGEIRVSVTEFVDTLAPIAPRLYSIASSQRKAGKEVHLTVGKVAYDRGGRQRKGVASTMLADRLSTGGTINVFVHPNHGGFTVPSDGDTPMIMVGPGTGIAPFLAFLQEREATSAKGKNWLFFGDQHRSTDFLYEAELRHYSESGLLTRLDTAFSRDGETKVYVQDRMREHAAELWQWLDSGAHFYVCGDASRMAKDVDRMLKTIVAQQSKVSNDEAAAYVTALAKQQRYVRDVY